MADNKKVDVKKSVPTKDHRPSHDNKDRGHRERGHANDSADLVVSNTLRPPVKPPKK